MCIYNKFTLTQYTTTIWYLHICTFTIYTCHMYAVKNTHPSHSCLTQGVGPNPTIQPSQHLFSSTRREASKLIRKSGGSGGPHLHPQPAVGNGHQKGKDRQLTTDRHISCIFNSLDVLKYDFEAPPTRSWTAYPFFSWALESSRKGTAVYWQKINMLKENLSGHLGLHIYRNFWVILPLVAAIEIESITLAM